MDSPTDLITKLLHTLDRIMPGRSTDDHSQTAQVERVNPTMDGLPAEFVEQAFEVPSPTPQAPDRRLRSSNAGLIFLNIPVESDKAEGSSSEDDAIGSPEEISAVYEPTSSPYSLSTESSSSDESNEQADTNMTDNTPMPTHRNAFAGEHTEQGTWTLVANGKSKAEMSKNGEDPTDHRAAGSPYYFLTVTEQRWMDKNLGYRFKNGGLLLEALQISGPGNGLKVVSGRPCPDGNKRLGFVGAQAIRTVIATEWYPGLWNTIELSEKLLDISCSDDNLERVCQDRKFFWVINPRGVKLRKRNMAKLTAAIFGAVFLDGGIDALRLVMQQCDVVNHERQGIMYGGLNSVPERDYEMRFDGIGL